LGVRFHVRHRWRGWTEQGDCRFDAPNGEITIRPRALILALGGGSWARLGSDGAWQAWLREQGITVHPLKPANCGFDTGWSPFFAERYAGAPVKPVVAEVTTLTGHCIRQRGECVISRTGLEGSLIYALSAPLRDAIEREGRSLLRLDLAPDRDEASLRERLSEPRGGRTLGQTLKRLAGLSPVKVGLLREWLDPASLLDAAQLAAAIKSLPVPVLATRPLDEAISSAGGVAFAELDAHYMLRARPGVFCSGEMLDWEAPTGGYLLSACLATGRVAGRGAAEWLRQPG
ncbi:MAG: TIGR03862 family flavoprotein, partial [Methylococcus sp.]